MSTTALVEGKIVQCIGAVIDVEFPRSDMPKIYDALILEGSELTLEVQQQLGDGVVRTICLGASDGLRRGTTVKNTGTLIGRGARYSPEGAGVRRTVAVDRAARNWHQGY